MGVYEEIVASIMSEIIHPENPFNPDKVKIPKIELNDEWSFRAGFLLFTEKGNAIAGNLITSKIQKSLEKLRVQDADREALLMMALAVNKPERVEWALKTLREYKQYIQINPEDLYKEVERLVDAFKTASNTISSLIKQSERAMEKRREQLPILESRLSKLIDFFRPKADSFKIKKITLLSVDQYVLEDAGSCFTFGDELVIASPIDNLDNFDHEFLHSVINPIVDKLEDELSDEQKEIIKKSAGLKLRQDYGEGYYSLLCEELIRTFNDFIKPGRNPVSLDEFKDKIKNITDEEFKKELKKSPSLALRCQQLGIESLDEMKDEAEEYFERYEKDELREKIFTFYQAYASESSKTPNLNFEDFILSNSSDLLSVSR